MATRPCFVSAALNQACVRSEPSSERPAGSQNPRGADAPSVAERRVAALGAGGATSAPAEAASASTMDASLAIVVCDGDGGSGRRARALVAAAACWRDRSTAAVAAPPRLALVAAAAAHRRGPLQRERRWPRPSGRCGDTAGRRRDRSRRRGGAVARWRAPGLARRYPAEDDVGTRRPVARRWRTAAGFRRGDAAAPTTVICTAARSPLGALRRAAGPPSSKDREPAASKPATVSNFIIRSTKPLWKRTLGSYVRLKELKSKRQCGASAALEPAEGQVVGTYGLEERGIGGETRKKRTNAQNKQTGTARGDGPRGRRGEGEGTGLTARN